MDLEHYRVLITAIDKKSLTAAAETLDYTVSGISRSIAALEKETGFPLLYRGKSGVQPTADCLRLLPSIRELLFSADRLSQTISGIRGGEQGIIGIGTAYRRYYRWITDVTSKFRELHPGIQFQIFNGTSTDFIARLEQHRLDFCLVSKRDGAHLWYPLVNDPLLALIPKDHPLASMKEIPIEAFCREPYIETCPGLDIDSARFFETRGIRPNTQFTTMDVQATYSMVEAGLGISVNNRINCMPGYPDVLHLPLLPAQDVEIGLACAEILSPAAESFLAFIKDKLPKDV